MLTVPGHKGNAKENNQQQMLVKMQGKMTIYTLLVGIQSSAVIMEISMEITLKN
jgi:hypothetical protein